MDASPAWITAGVSTAVAFASGIVAYVRAITRNDEQIKALREDHAELKSMIDAHTRMVGESLQAMRQHVSDRGDEIAEAQMWNRDTFVRRDDHAQTIGGINGSLASLRSLVDSSMLRLNDKLDEMRKGLEEKIDRIKN